MKLGLGRRKSKKRRIRTGGRRVQWSETSLWSQVTQELHSCPHWFALIPLILLYRNRIKWAEKRPQSGDRPVGKVGPMLTSANVAGRALYTDMQHPIKRTGSLCLKWACYANTCSPAITGHGRVLM